MKEEKKAMGPKLEEATGGQANPEEELELAAGGVEYGQASVQFGDYHVVGNDYYICHKCGRAVLAKDDHHHCPPTPMRQ